MSQKKPDSSKSLQTPVTYLAISRRWFISLAAVLILPWLAIAAIWLKPSVKTGADVTVMVPMSETRAGKWGNLKLAHIVLSPPEELIFTDWGFMGRPIWFFPGANADLVSQILQSAGVSESEIARQLARARFEPRIKGTVVEPDPAWVRALNPDTRARIYKLLAKSGLNVDQRQAFRYPGSNLQAWLSPDLVAPQMRQLIEPLVYRDGNYMLLSDIELLRPEIGGEDNMRKIGKALFRQPTVLARLAIGPKTDIDALVDYWGHGGRRTDIRPLLESVSGRGDDGLIDVIHLLPTFARNHLYRYPKLSVTDLDRPIVVNCLWSSLNFFIENPNDRFLEEAVALKTLKEDYFVVEANFELGDIVAFLDEQGNIFHAAVYIADDLLFSKNGISAMAPWTISSLKDVKDFYRWYSDNPRLIFHRRRDL